MRAQAMLMTGRAGRRSRTLFFFVRPLSQAGAAVRERSGGGSEVVERRPVDRFAEDESGAAPTTHRVSPREPQTLPAQNAAAAASLRRISLNLKATSRANELPKPKRRTRRDRRALCQRL